MFCSCKKLRGICFFEEAEKLFSFLSNAPNARCLILEHESDDDSYEVLDLTEYARRHHWWNRLFGRNSGPIVEKYSVATQIVIGGVTGWCAGFLFQKVGKLAATAVGGGFLLLQTCLLLFLDSESQRLCTG
uniref:FUN14 domain-containing protein 1 isoform X4 n=1 Tax=Pogona vitticeps TaxID=103695 RepID=A0ABM5FY18_9SAUR